MVHKICFNAVLEKEEGRTQFVLARIMFRLELLVQHHILFDKIISFIFSSAFNVSMLVDVSLCITKLVRYMARYKCCIIIITMLLTSGENMFHKS